MNKPSTEQLNERIEQLKASGVVDIKLFRNDNRISTETIAKNVLDLMDAPEVNDSEMF